MKTVVSLLVLFGLLGVGTQSFAAEEFVGSGEPAWSHPDNVNRDELTNGYSFINPLTRANSCYAWTNCWNGRQISCWAYGAGCRYSWQNGVYVHCEGYGYNGSWYNNTQYCY